MSREKAKEILDDNMSECTSHHVQKMDYLEQWIIDAMIEYAHSQAKNNEVLDLVSGMFTYEFANNVELKSVIHVIQKTMSREPQLTDSESFEKALIKHQKLNYR